MLVSGDYICARVTQKQHGLRKNRKSRKVNSSIELNKAFCNKVDIICISSDQI